MTEKKDRENEKEERKGGEGEREKQKREKARNDAKKISFVKDADVDDYHVKLGRAKLRHNIPAALAMPLTPETNDISELCKQLRTIHHVLHTRMWEST